MTEWTKRALAGSPANYWELSEADLSNMQWTCVPLQPGLPVFRRPHACVSGVVAEVLSEDDGDHHLWLRLDGTTKGRVACEFTPQQRQSVPKVGQHIRIYGILRYDLEHQWSEIHPVDGWEPLDSPA